MKTKLYSLYILHILNDGLQSVLLLLLPFIAMDINLSISQVGNLGSLLHVLGIVFSIPSGYIAYKFGGFRVLTITTFAIACGFLATAFSPSFTFLAFGFLLTGFGFAFFTPIGLALISKILPKENRPSEMGNYSAIGDLGKVGLTATVSFLVGLLGWRGTSLVYSISTVSVFVVLVYLFLIKNKDNYVKPPENISLEKWKSVIKNKLFIYTTASATIDTLGSSQLFIFLPFLFLHKNIDPLLLGPFTAVFFLGNVFGKTLAGMMATRYGSARIFIFSEVFMALTILIISASEAKFFMLILSFVLGFISKWTSPTAMAMLAESSGNHDTFDIDASIYSFMRSITKAVSPALLGLIATKFGIVSTFYFAAVVVLFATIPAFQFEKLVSKKSRL